MKVLLKNLYRFVLKFLFFVSSKKRNDRLQTVFKRLCIIFPEYTKYWNLLKSTFDQLDGEIVLESDLQNLANLNRSVLLSKSESSLDFSRKFDAFLDFKRNPLMSAAFPFFTSLNLDSFSQDGEDLVLRSLLDVNKKGFYVDVGAHDPYRFSNTAFFYLQGWRGINIDPNSRFKEYFDFCRPGDINLEVAIGPECGETQVYTFAETALNTTLLERAQYLEKETSYKPISVRHVPVFPLREIFKKYLPVDQSIDFLSIDVEGLEMGVLMSNDWELYRPMWILVEDLKGNKITSSVGTYLQEKNYGKIAFTGRTIIFKSEL